MAITGIFYTFSKKENSTAVPSGQGISINLIVKDGSGIINPVIMLTGVDNPTSYNFLKIQAFGGRYYNINEWTYDRGTWTASCSVDVLATYRASINLAEKYILRASDSAKWDGDIIDNYYPAKAGTHYTGAGYSDMWGTPCVILGIVSNLATASTRGALAYYVLSGNAMEDFFGWLLGKPSDDNSGNVFLDAIWSLLNIADQTMKTVIDPMSWIKTAMYLPFTPTNLVNQNGTIHVGTYDISMISGGVYTINPYGVETTHAGFIQTVAIPKHPQASARGAFLNSSPYSRYILNCQPYGRIPIDANLLKNSVSLKLQQSVDLITGEGCLYIYALDGEGNTSCWINTVYAQIGCSVPLAQISQNFLGAGASFLSGAVGMVTGAMTGGVSSAISGAGDIINAVDTILPQGRETGSASGSILPYVLAYPFLEYNYMILPDANDQDAGRPVCKRYLISSLANGYLKVADGEISISGTMEEKERIKSYLEGGFFKE